MTYFKNIDYSKLDIPEILATLFHPRFESDMPDDQAESIIDFTIPVEHDVAIGGRYHHYDASAPNLLFFHGNGEIARDYDDIGRVYRQAGINFLVVDYRGYGRSTGTPTVTSMMKDAHVIFNWSVKQLAIIDHTGPLIVMGRSLGSASAIELACYYEDKLKGLIIESGFSYVLPLLKILGVDTDSLGITEEDGPQNIDKIKSFSKPTLVIHAENDHLIPFEEGQALYDTSVAQDKRFLKIPFADHNTIFYHGMNEYMAAIKEFIKGIGPI